MSDLRKAAEMALKDWLANDEGVVKFGMELKPEWVSTASHGFISGYEEALRQALAQPVDAVNISQERVDETAKREHEPVAWVLYYNNEQGTPMREIFYGKAYMEETKSYNETHRGLKCQVVPLYTAPPKREWVGLTEAERVDILDDELTTQGTEHFALAQAIEAKLKEKNGG